MLDVSLETILLGLIFSSVLFGAVAIAVHAWRTRKPATGAAAEGEGDCKSPAGQTKPVTAQDAEILHESSLQLVNEAATLLKIIRQQIAAGDRFGNSLAEADRTFAKVSDPEQVRMVIKFLVTENAKMQKEQGELKSRLEQSQNQIEALRYKVAEAEEVSLKDPLTSIANRRAFDADLTQAIGDAKTLKHPLCLIMCDIDHFKKLNDAYGHPVGDEVLKIFANILTENVRAGDTVARYGGEEFAVVLTRSDMQTAARVCERMRLDIASRKLSLNRNGEIIGNITASFGVAQFLADDTPETLLQRADEKLYEAKTGGRNRVVIDRSAIAA
ncbi:MAG: GGDEF domain-containing protein [Hyphomicrobiales bacterium]|nr:MAG: GGDEF domain-containing protein [Hyphomicrobiales bacterium]